MHTFYGIWVDHAHAYLIKANKMADMEIDEMLSDVEPHHHGGIEGGERLSMTDQKSHDDRRKNQMKAFSKELIKRIKNADEIVIFGPGTAKNELKNVMEKEKSIVDKIKGLETTDKLSEAEMKDFVKTFFKLPRD